MTQTIGRIAGIGIAKETVRGTSEAAPTFWIPFNTVDIQEKYQTAINNQAFGVIEGSVGEDIVKKWAEGSWKSPVTDKHFALVLFATLGALSTGSNADGSGTVKDHTITVGQSSQHQALSIFIDDPAGGQDYKHALGVLNDLEIAYEMGKYLEYTANIKAKKGATATLTQSTNTENRFTSKHVSFKLATTQAGLTAASVMNIRSLKLKFANSVEDDDILGSDEPNDFLNKEFTIEGTLEAIWKNETDYKQTALAGTYKAMRVDMKNTDVTIGTSANPMIRIDLHKVFFKEISRAFNTGDVIKQTLSFRAHYNATDSKMVTIVATNLQASY